MRKWQAGGLGRFKCDGGISGPSWGGPCVAQWFYGKLWLKQVLCNCF